MCLEAGNFEGLNGLIDLLKCDDDIYVCCRKGLCGPMINRQPSDHAPRNFEALEHLNQSENISPAARSLPVVELPFRQSRTRFTKKSEGN